MFTIDEIIEARLTDMFYGDVPVFGTENPQEIQDILTTYDNYHFYCNFRVGERTYTATLTIKENR